MGIELTDSLAEVPSEWPHFSHADKASSKQMEKIAQFELVGSSFRMVDGRESLGTFGEAEDMLEGLLAYEIKMKI